MHFIELVDASRDVTGVSGRLAKIERLAAVLKSASPEEVETAVAFLSGTTRQGRIGVGHAAIAGASDAPAADGATLAVRDVDGAFAAVSGLSGQGSARERTRILRELFARATRAEQDFLRRLLYGELRQGALEGVLVEAVARAAAVDSRVVRRAVMMAGDLGAVAHAALTGGGAALGAMSIQLMRPIQPMLADSANDVAEAIEQLGDASVEYKLDGARVQIHKAGDAVRLFSRTLNDVTDSAPE